MQIQAAVTESKGAEFKIQEVTLDQPKDNEILVKIVATGICFTDLSARDQRRPLPLPAVLGHEGSGIVEKVGANVESVQPGDHVIVSFSSCGECKHCKNNMPYACENFFYLNFKGFMADGTHRLHLGDQPLSSFFGQASLATHAVVNERSVVKIDKDVPLEIMGPLGCGIQTGSGAVLNRMKPEPGSSFAVFGCGTVGLSGLMAAKVAGCSTIVAVDIHENRLELAKELGATHTINAAKEVVVSRIMEITGDGLNYALEAAGNPKVLRQAFDSIGQMGLVVLCGGTQPGTEVSIEMPKLLYERTIAGVIEGDSVPREFIPKLIDLYKEGKFPIEKLMKFYTFDQVNEAADDMVKGTTIKPILIVDEGWKRA